MRSDCDRVMCLTGSAANEPDQGFGLEINRSSEAGDQTSTLEFQAVEVEVAQLERHLTLRKPLEINGPSVGVCFRPPIQQLSTTSTNFPEN